MIVKPKQQTMTETELNQALDRLASNNAMRASGDLRSRIDARIRDARINYVKMHYAAAILIAMLIIGAAQVRFVHRKAVAEKKKQSLDISNLSPQNTLYHE
jgi:hypothetical protein